MLSLARCCLCTLAAGAVPSFSGNAEAQTMIRSFEQLMPITFESSEPLTTGYTSVRPTTVTGGWLERAADREVHRLTRSMVFVDSALRARQKSVPQKRSWIGRHPVLFGTLVGFGGGLFIGYVPGDGAVIDDYVASFNGLVIGGIGAGAGAAIGAAVGSSTK